MAIAALVLGIISIILVFNAKTVVVSLICAIIGVILGASARKTYRQYALATAGFICSIIALVVVCLYLACALACVGSITGAAAFLGAFN